MLLSKKLAFLGATCFVIFRWIARNGFRAWLQARIPAWLALDFATIIAFITLIVTALRTIPQMVASFTSAVLSLDFAAIFYRLRLIIVAFVALLLGPELERRIQTTS